MHSTDRFAIQSLSPENHNRTVPVEIPKGYHNNLLNSADKVRIIRLDDENKRKSSQFRQSNKVSADAHVLSVIADATSISLALQQDGDKWGAKTTVATIDLGAKIASTVLAVALQGLMPGLGAPVASFTASAIGAGLQMLGRGLVLLLWKEGSSSEGNFRPALEFHEVFGSMEFSEIQVFSSEGLEVSGVEEMGCEEFNHDEMYL